MREISVRSDVAAVARRRTIHALASVATAVIVRTMLNYRTPRTFTLEIRLENIQGDVAVFHDLEIIHTDAEEIGPILEGVAEAVAGMERSGRKHFEGDPRLG